MIKRFLAVLIMILISSSMNSQIKELEEGVDFKLVDKVPVANGCNKNWSNEDLRICFTKYVSNTIVQNVSNSFLQNQGLEPGSHRINVIFAIDEKGRISDIRTDSDNRKIDKHLIKAVKSIEKMDPGLLDGKAVKILYSLPIAFKIV
ncbi:energy transducer TonB [Gillisia sp. M10.2A]|uniref:Energy transducer TonB n=1 Tax=Gillisia lutea TaxID=2909668 RepID=A0ABS9EIZ8_9FLAO|nr:energy transducer TonB [Gillisia lutea]MCF4102842.1 energy transducer TonB [Gillisia lutea]